MRPYYIIKKLPDPFVMNDGSRVATPEEWEARRKEILAQALEVEFGTQPPAPEEVHAELLADDTLPSGERTQRCRLVMIPSKEHPDIEFTMIFNLFLPPPEALVEKRALVPGFASDGRLPVHVFVGGEVAFDVLDRGYMHVAYEKTSIQFDFGKGNAEVPPGSCKDAYRVLNDLEPGKWEFTWGNISAWAWGLSRLLDYLLTRDDVDSDHIIVSGHSVNGKTALLAAALDDRFSMVNPSGTGCGGCASYLVLDGLFPDGCFEQQTEPPEDLKALTSKYRWYHWMAPALHEFSGREQELPFDRHFVMATIAPRLLFQTEGDQDWWANPAGTTAGYLATDIVFQWLGCGQKHGITWHHGGHTHGDEDRAAVLDFADWHWFGITCNRDFRVLHAHSDAIPRMDDLVDWSAPD
jgi:hypothetical protein